MVELAILGLVCVITFATSLALADSWLRARFTLACLQEEHDALSRGFVPMVDATESRARSCGDFAAFTAGRMPKPRQAVRSPLPSRSARGVA